MTTDRIWSYAPDSAHVEGQDLTNCVVTAADGVIGHVDREADHHGMRHLVVDTGVWVFGRSVLVPVGVVTGVDIDSRTITLACTRGEVKAAPASAPTAKPWIPPIWPASATTTIACRRARRPPRDRNAGPLHASTEGSVQ